MATTFKLGDTDEDKHGLHLYREVAIALKHSGDPLGLRPALACVGRRFPVINSHGIVPDPHGLLVVMLRINAEHSTRPDQ